MTQDKNRTILRILSIGILSLMPMLAVDLPATERSEKRAQIGSLLRASNEYLAAGKYDSVVVSLEMVRELDPNHPDAFYCEAVMHLALEDTSRAMEVLGDGVARAPLSSRLKLLLTRLLVIEGSLDEADGLLETLLRFKPRDPETLYLKGRLNLARGDTTLALDNWQSALEYVEQKGTPK